MICKLIFIFIFVLALGLQHKLAGQILSEFCLFLVCIICCKLQFVTTEVCSCITLEQELCNLTVSFFNKENLPMLHFIRWPHL